mmetsp:Transcript_13973/g.30215  ORF Transcript_13973/g.30215 Transcript_13973/m.30215 type:complete len:624 (-) Transcript_13973:1251-3122(-)
MQVFYWGQLSHTEGDRTYYTGFTLANNVFSLGDCVYLYPEDAGLSHYIGKIVSAFSDASPNATDAHCVEVKWYERRVNLEPGFRGSLQIEKELVELEEADVNPIGCISGKCTVFRAKSYEEAHKLAKGLGSDWYFSRGVFKQSNNKFVLYQDMEQQPLEAKRTVKRPQHLGSSEDVGDSEDVARQRCEGKRQRTTDNIKGHGDRMGGMVPLSSLQSDDDRLIKRGSKTGAKQCVECGATSTPQWREGPAGPKTLCNACGVRYVRAQQRANKRGGSASARAAFSPTNGRVKGYGKSEQVKMPSAAALPGMVPVNSNITPEPAYNTAPSVPSRPMRQAAVLAANRTAAYARTGVFPMGDMDAKGSGYAQPSNENEGSSHNSSDSAEEMYDSSAPGPVPGSQPQRVTEPTQEHMQQAAAVNAHTVQVAKEEPAAAKGEDVAPSAPAPPPAAAVTAAPPVPLSPPTTIAHGMAVVSHTPAAPTAAVKLPVDAPTLIPSKCEDGLLHKIAVSASQYCKDVDATQVFASFEGVRSQLPQEALQKLDSISEQVERATSEAEIASAALAAVSQVMAARQEAADRARSAAADAIQKLKGYMSSLVQQYGGASTTTGSADSAWASAVLVDAGV